MSVCLSVRIKAEISETVKARLLGLGMQIPELLTQRKFVSAECHAHFNAQTVAPVAPKIFVLDKKNFFWWRARRV